MRLQNNKKRIYRAASKPKVIVIFGPTAVGKTSFAIKLAGTFNCRIVSADSMQIYKYMDIGTAKPTKEERALVPHYMIDLVTPDVSFDAAKYAKIAGKYIKTAESKNFVPLVVGGTGLYIRALINGLFSDGQSSQAIKDKLKKQAQEFGSDFLYKKLYEYDPVSAEQTHKNDLYRIVRDLEIYERTGKPASEHRKEHGFSSQRFDILKIFLCLERKSLYRRIEARVDYMIQDGFVDEVKWLLNKGYNSDLKSMKSIGYRHIAAYLENQADWELTIETLKRDTRRYAKRQLTWFRKETDTNKIGPFQLNKAKRLITDFLY